MTSRILHRPTLVLNRHWQPVNVATVARALVLLWSESARVVDPKDFQFYTWADWPKLGAGNGDDCICAVRFKLRVPEAVALCDYDRLPVAQVAFSRWKVFKRIVKNRVKVLTESPLDCRLEPVCQELNCPSNKGLS